MSDVTLREAGSLKSVLELTKPSSVLAVVGADQWTAPSSDSARGIAVCAEVLELEVLALLVASASSEVVEDVVVALSGWWTDDSGAFKVVFEGFSTVKSTAIVELKLSVLAEPGSVCVVQRPCVTESFEDELSRRDLIAELVAFLAGWGEREVNDGPRC